LELGNDAWDELGELFGGAVVGVGCFVSTVAGEDDSVGGVGNTGAASAALLSLFIEAAAVGIC